MYRTPKTQAIGCGGKRRGSVLIVVLVLVMMLTLAVYGFTERMLIENQAAVAHGRAAQAMSCAASGIEFAASTVSLRAADPANSISLYHRPDLFAGVILYESASPSAVGRFSLVAPLAGDPTASLVRFGLSDESGKLNINSITATDLDEIEQATMLMGLPGMTEELTDAILDYLDDDQTPRPLGAESDYYQGLAMPYFAKNGPLESVNELLMVRGVTPELLFGEDANRNGLLDPAENDGANSPPLDNADGMLQMGWNQFLTVYSRESNSRADGTPKILINQKQLTDLYDAIVTETGDKEIAKFIAAYRMYGPKDGEEESGEGEAGRGDGEREGDGEGETGSDRSEASDGRDDEEVGNSDEESRSESDERERGGGEDRESGESAEAGSEESEDAMRDGLDLSRGGQHEIKSLYDLIDREVEIEADEEAGTEAKTLTSPWTSAGILTDYPMLLDLFALSEKPSIVGRVNVNEARYEVLMGLPGMTEQIADNIVGARGSVSGGAVAADPSRQTTAWLVAQNFVVLETMRKLDPFLTGRGDVFRVQSVGFFDGGGPRARVEAIIDGTAIPAKIVMYRDLTALHRGYTPIQLLGNGG